MDTEDHASNERRDGRERRGTQQLDHDNTSAGHVLPGQQATTKAGKTRQRLTWNTQMNLDVMRCYYKSTNLESITMKYSYNFYNLFIEKYPEYQNYITPQRLMDQKRMIIKNKKLTEREIQDIKEQIAAELNLTPSLAVNQNQVSQLEQNSTQIANVNLDATIRLHRSQANNPEVLNSSTTTLSDNQERETPPITRSPNDRETNSADELHAKIDDIINYTITRWNAADPNARAPLPKLNFKGRTTFVLQKVNARLTSFTELLTTMEKIHLLIYAGATAVIMLNEQPINENLVTRPQKRKALWQDRIERKISRLRRDIGRLTQYQRGNWSKRVIKFVREITQDLRIPPIEALDTAKQKLAVYSNRLRRYKESDQRRMQNAQFIRSQKQFYKTLRRTSSPIIIPPTVEHITTFWESIWSQDSTHNRSATWIEKEKETYNALPQQVDSRVTVQELKDAIQRTNNWKAPGADHIHNFWYKSFTSLHEHLTNSINEMIQDPKLTPYFLTQGITYIIPKNENTLDPANYRPITCLPTIYKVITSIIANKIEKHITANNILSEEQKGCRKKSRGCKEQIIIDSVVMEQTRRRKRNLITCYIDYKKAFDSIPHSWLSECLQIYKIDQSIQNFLVTNMKNWRTTIKLRTDTEQIATTTIKIRKGIFQGDSLSALWFCLCLNPLSNALNTLKIGYNIKHERSVQHTICHLLYMDDIKLFASNRRQMDLLLDTTEQITNDIRMEFGMSKCKTIHIEKGRYEQEVSNRILNSELLGNMEPNETYKYLGIEQSTKIDHTDLKQKLTAEYKDRLGRLLKSRLNSKNLCVAINTYAIPVLTYSFGIIKWSNTDLENLDRLNRTQLTKYRKHHPKACNERITIKRASGGRGLMDIRNLHNNQIQKLREFFLQKNTSLHKAIIKADDSYTPLNLSCNNEDFTPRVVTMQQKMDIWSSKVLHGKHPTIMQQEAIDKELSYRWLISGHLFPETEGFVVAIQDGVIKTRNYMKHILKINIDDDKCRKCHLFPETIDHITSGCRMLAGTEYTARHNNAAKIIHQELAVRCKLLSEEIPYYKYTPQNIMENGEYKIYWDTGIFTDRSIVNNRPDITLVDKAEKKTYIIDIAIPNDSNTIYKEQAKIAKYLPLAAEIKEIWRQNEVSIIPIVISVTGITTKYFRKHIGNLQMQLNIHSKIQKAVILDTTAIVRKFLQVTHTGDIITT